MNKLFKWVHHNKASQVTVNILFDLLLAYFEQGMRRVQDIFMEIKVSQVKHVLQFDITELKVGLKM